MTWLMNSAARRIALVSFLAYAMAILVLGMAVYGATHAAFSRQIDVSIEQSTHALIAEYRDDGIAGLSRDVDLRKAPGPIWLGIGVFAADGRRLAGDLATTMPAPGWQRITFFDPLEGQDRARAKVTVLPGGYRLVVAADLADLEAIDRAILSIFAMAMAAMLAIGVGGAVLLARYLRGKLGMIEETASAIVAGDLGRRATIGPHHDEFDRVAGSLNIMLDQIAALIANLRQISADLAHDLRTPLAALRNHLERMEPGRIEPGQIEIALRKTDDVLDLFDAILRISEVEAGSLRRAFAPVDIAALLAELSDTLALLAQDGGRRLDARWQPGLYVHGDRQLLAQAIINLAENAMRHTPPGAWIDVSVARNAEQVILQVRDNGPGIAIADRERVLRRFVRLEASRSTPGHGLGLSLVAAIAHAHDAGLILGDAGPGLIVTLTFPRKSAT